ncbi:hypothetical protein K7432_006857 [Basidiobolus ranarum]|uniref:Uncharacterized protein n=1 Tax=Basidiobolus ranarum TaxID=34480 RepID=A0ABR2W114_9FUNG
MLLKLPSLIGNAMYNIIFMPARHGWDSLAYTRTCRPFGIDLELLSSHLTCQSSPIAFTWILFVGSLAARLSLLSTAMSLEVNLVSERSSANETLWAVSDNIIA